MDRVLGIDFAAQPKNTWAAEGCVTENGHLRITEIENGITDEDVVAKTNAGYAVIAIDAPFGWPWGFSEFISQRFDGHSPRQVNREDFRFRETDRFIHDQFGKWPLSVSTDRLGIVAHRLVSITTKMVHCTIPPFHRPGPDPTLIEVYPAATLIALGLRERGYKKDPEIRREIVKDLARFGIEIRGEMADQCVLGDDALDAVICALTGHLYARGETMGPEHLKSPRAGVVSNEGWIYVPAKRT